MNNEGFTGFLISKTLQPFPIRDQSENFNDYRDRNIIMYLQKKFGQLKKRGGAPSTQQYSNTPLQVKPKVNKPRPQVDIKLKFEPKVIKLLKEEAIRQNKTKEESQECRKRKNNLQIPTQQLLQLMINQSIDEVQLIQLYNQYKRCLLKASLQEFQTKDKLQQEVDFDDMDQVNFFMAQLCDQSNLRAGQLLKVDDKDIDYNQEIKDEQETLKTIKQNRITKEQLQDIMRDEERKQNNQLVQIFKETRIDQFDPDFFKNKVKMTTIKRVNQAQDDQFQQFFQAQQQVSIGVPKEAHYRSKQKSFMKPIETAKRLRSTQFSAMNSTRPQSSTSRYLKSARSANIEGFFSSCELTENNFRKDTGHLKQKFLQLDYLFQKVSSHLNPKTQAQVTEPQFEEFQKQRIFKKKFVNYLMDRVNKPSDLVSLKVQTVKSQELIDRMINQN